jgi:cytochrome c oxidase subunit 3
VTRRESRLQLQFESLEKQTHAARLGMWLFLASELLLFSALFTLYASYRAAYPRSFHEGVAHTRFASGAAMTVVLITSSLTVALAVDAIRRGRRGACLAWLGGCIGLGLLFLGLKAAEYADHLSHGIRPGVHYVYAELPERGAALFFTLYYLMTGLHAVHVIAGLIVLAVVGVGVRRGRYDAGYHTPVELGGLYWHLVDIIWLFLWPVFYLMH